MKNFYLLTLIVLSFTFTLNAQNAQNAEIIFEDDFESYPIGPMECQNPPVWLCDPLYPGIVVTDIFASSGVQSGNIPPDQVTFAVLLLGNKDYAEYSIRFDVYVPSGATGYWSIQQEETPGSQLNGQWFIDATTSGGSAGVITYDITGATIPYPNDQWFEIFYLIDLDFVEIFMWVDGALFLDAEPYQGTWLGALNFFSIDGNNDLYIDDVLYDDLWLGVDDFSADVFRVYPNPVRDVLNISSKVAVDFITVYDILGNIILQAQPDVISPSINMSALQSGTYLVNITIGNASKTIKVIKQ